jgi:hypothetical protein
LPAVRSLTAKAAAAAFAVILLLMMEKTSASRLRRVNRALVWMFMRWDWVVGWCDNPSFSNPRRMNNLLKLHT